MYLPLILSVALPVAAHAAGLPVVHGAVQVQTPVQVQVGQPPLLVVSVPDRPSVIFIECTVRLPGGGARTFGQTSPVLAAGEAAELALEVVPPTSQATCLVVASFANGLSERRPVELSWTWVDVPTPEEQAPPPEEGVPPPTPTAPAIPTPPSPPVASPRAAPPG